MPRHARRVALALPLLVALAGAGCAGPQQTAQVAAPAAVGPEVHPISPESLEAIEHAFAVTYASDFEHCFEAEMERTERDRLRAEFSLEADIDTQGRITDTRLVRAHTPEADADLRADFHGPHGIAERFHGCVEAKLDDWELPHPPESPYTHTLGLSLGEAW